MGQAVDRGHLLSRAGSAAGEGSAVPSIASTPRHSTVHRLDSGAAAERARSDPPSEARLPDADDGERALALLPAASERPDLLAYVDLKLSSVNRILNGGEGVDLHRCVWRPCLQLQRREQPAWGRPVQS